MAVLDVVDIRKSYGPTKAVDGVSFKIAGGEIFGLLGPNGAGKSTTINIIATLIAADSGSVSVDGITPARSAEYKRLIGYVPQEISLSEKLTAREYLAFVARLYDLAGSDLRDRVERQLAAVGLADRGGHLIGTFSGGMKRRLNIACALMHDPRLLLMDEPTAGVDPQARAYIFDIVDGLAAQGRAILYTTHYMEEAQRLCKRTAIIDHGQILAIGTLDELVQRAGARRDLIVAAPDLTSDIAARLAGRLAAAEWKLDAGEARFAVQHRADTLLEAVRAATELGLRPTHVGIREPDLETAFLELTGRALRE